ncbi:MAG: hypothetical protein J6V29_00925, partial [Bacteroidales bacterium]|nr:hypothetical protein [Bacteroidales bacterium]
MKKYFLSLVAMAAAMLFATSCQESLVEPQIEGPTTFTVQVPDQMGTKAGEDSYQLFVEVYSAEGDESYHRNDEPIVMAVGTPTTVTLNLVANQAYDIIFWAQKNANSYGVGDLSTVQMNANHHNSETGAAFYAVLNNYNPTQGKQDVKLTRPFAQLNFYTNNNVSYGSVQVLRSTIKVTNVATSFNRVADKTYGEGVTTGTYTYTSRDTENTNRDLPVGDPKNIDGVSYQYVSMDYLAVPGNEALVDIEATFFVKDSKDVKSEIKRTFEGIPVQMNYRTNIIGNLITSASDFKVEISEVWGGEDNNVVKTEVSTADELKAAIENTVGGEIVLTDDIELTESLVFGMSAGTKSGETAESDYVLDLNGRIIIGKMHKSVGAVIENNGTLTIKNGTISSTAANGGSAIQNNGTLTVEGATLNGAPNADGSWPSYTVNNTGVMTATNTTFTSYHGSVASYGDGAVVTLNNSEIDMAGIPGFTSHGIYTYNSGKVVVNGGTYTNKATDQASSGASVINGAVEVNDGTFTGRIENYYGTPVLKGGIYSVKPNEKFIAEGYKAVVKDGKFYVVEGDVDIVITDPNQLTPDVIKEYSNIYLAAPGEYYADLYDIDYKETLTITGTEGVKFAHTADKYGQLRIEQIQNFTIRNCEILKRVVGDKNWGMMVFSTGRPNGVYTIENCTFNGVGTQGIYINEKNSSAVYHIKNCTFNEDFGTEGAITISTNADVKHTVNVTDCEFNNVPADHRIYLTAGSGGLSSDFTLNTNLKVSTANELVMFLSLRSDVIFANDIQIDPANMSNAYGKTGINVKNGQTIDGNGHTLNIKGAGGTWDSGINTTGGLIKNITVTGSFRGI